MFLVTFRKQAKLMYGMRSPDWLLLRKQHLDGASGTLQVPTFYFLIWKVVTWVYSILQLNCYSFKICILYDFIFHWKLCLKIHSNIHLLFYPKITLHFTLETCRTMLRPLPELFVRLQKDPISCLTGEI